jgi:hypothetical protein
VFNTDFNIKSFVEDFRSVFFDNPSAANSSQVFEQILLWTFDLSKKSGGAPMDRD